MRKICPLELKRCPNVIAHITKTAKGNKETSLCFLQAMLGGSRIISKMVKCPKKEGNV